MLVLLSVFFTIFSIELAVIILLLVRLLHEVEGIEKRKSPYFQ